MGKKAVYFLLSILSVVGLMGLDQLTKQWAKSHLADGDPWVVWEGVFQLKYLENRGAAFGILQNHRILFLVITLAVLFFLLFWYVRLSWRRRNLPLRIALLLLFAGAAGNLIDRLARGFVIDFFYVEWINFPIFNVADIYVTLAAILLLILLIFVYKEDEWSKVFPFRKKEGKREG